jgi:glycine/D-amino acid oxidase-like deaminating enzyme
MQSIEGSPDPEAARRAHVVVVGGGIIGAALAYFLSRELPGAAPARVTVVERDPVDRGGGAGTSRSASAIRQQFSQTVNIRLAQWSFAFYAQADAVLAVDGTPPHLGLVEAGSLVLAPAGGLATLREQHAAHRAAGVAVALLGPTELAARFPWLYLQDIAAGSLGLRGEGWIDEPAVLRAFRRKAAAQGVTFRHARAVGFDTHGDHVRAVRLDDGLDPIAADTVVLSAGAWTAPLATLLGMPLPVVPRKRDVFLFTSPGPMASPGAHCPLVIDPSGVWFRPEGRGYLCGGPPHGADADAPPLEVDPALFDAVLWPALARRVPAFEAARVQSSESGYTDMNTFDGNGLVGAVPGFANAWLACGFSGHGLQQAPAVGVALAERIRMGRFHSVDPSALDPARFAAGRPAREPIVI